MNRNFFSLILLDKQNETNKPGSQRQRRKRIRDARVKQQNASTDEPDSTEVRPPLDQDEEEYLPKRKRARSTQDYVPENKYAKRQSTFNDDSAPTNQEAFTRSNGSASGNKNGMVINIKPLCHAIRELSIALNSTASLHAITKLNEIMLHEFNEVSLDGNPRKDEFTKNIQLLSNTVDSLVHNQWTGQPLESIQVVEKIDHSYDSRGKSSSQYASKPLLDAYDESQKMDNSRKKDSIESSTPLFSYKHPSKPPPRLLDSYDESPSRVPTVGQCYQINDDAPGNVWAYYSSLLGENQPHKGENGKKNFTETLREHRPMKMDRIADKMSTNLVINQVDDVSVNLWDHYSTLLEKNYSQKAGTQNLKTKPSLRDTRQIENDRIADKMSTNLVINQVDDASVNLWDHYFSLLGEKPSQKAGTNNLKETQPPLEENRQVKKDRTQVRNHHKNIPANLEKLYRNESYLSEVSEEVTRGISWGRHKNSIPSNNNEQHHLAYEMNKYLRNKTDRDINNAKTEQFFWNNNHNSRDAGSQNKEFSRQVSGSNDGNSNDATDLNYYSLNNIVPETGGNLLKSHQRDHDHHHQRDHDHHHQRGHDHHHQRDHDHHHQRDHDHHQQRDHGLPNLSNHNSFLKQHTHTPSYNLDEIINSIWVNTAATSDSSSRYNHDYKVGGRNAAADSSPVSHFIKPDDNQDHTAADNIFRNGRIHQSTQHGLTVLWSGGDESYTNAADQKAVCWTANKNTTAMAMSDDTSSASSLIAADSMALSSADSAFSIQSKNERKGNYPPHLNGPEIRSQNQKIINGHDSTLALFSSRLFFRNKNYPYQANNNNNYNNNNNSNRNNNNNNSVNDFGIDERETIFNPRLFLTRNMAEYYDQSGEKDRF